MRHRRTERELLLDIRVDDAARAAAWDGLLTEPSAAAVIQAVRAGDLAAHDGAVQLV